MIVATARTAWVMQAGQRPSPPIVGEDAREIRQVEIEHAQDQYRRGMRRLELSRAEAVWTRVMGDKTF